MSMLEKHRERNTIVRARDPFLDGGSTELPERERNRQKEALPSPASNIKQEIYARTSVELRKTLFSTGRKSFEIHPTEKSRSRLASASGTSTSINPRSTGYVVKLAGVIRRRVKAEENFTRISLNIYCSHVELLHFVSGFILLSKNELLIKTY